MSVQALFWVRTFYPWTFIWGVGILKLGLLFSRMTTGLLDVLVYLINIQVLLDARDGSTLFLIH